MDVSNINGALFQALSQAQGEIENASKNSANPHFRSKYADLAEILNTVRPVFSKYGLSMIQSTEFDGSLVSVVTLIAHKDGGFLTSRASCVPAKTDAQGIGSATTYLRRYGAAAAAGIAQEDDDGNAAAHNGKPNPVSATGKVSPSDGCWNGVDEEQRQFLETVAAKFRGMVTSGDVDGALAYMSDQRLTSDEKICVNTLLDSKTRSTLKKAREADKSED